MFSRELWPVPTRRRITHSVYRKDCTPPPEEGHSASPDATANFWCQVGLKKVLSLNQKNPRTPPRPPKPSCGRKGPARWCPRTWVPLGVLSTFTHK